jgi:hypothetical protein
MPPYGPAGAGWPLGRQVFGPELMAAALQVEGIDYLEPVQLADLDDNGNWTAPAQSITLQAWEVVQLSSIAVVTGTPLAPGQAIPAPPPSTVLPIPVPKDQC